MKQNMLRAIAGNTKDLAMGLSSAAQGCFRATVAATLAATLMLAAGPIVAADAWADAPADTVRTTVDQVREKVTQLEGKATPQQLDTELRAIIAPVFDFDTMAQSCLGVHWATATPDQQKEFVELFSGLLAKTYFKKIRQNAADTKMEILGEKTKGDKAIVKTHIAYNGQNAAIEYRMRQHGPVWRIYDVVIENIGLVSNYRSEFAGIVKNEKMDGLLDKLRKKSAGQPQ